MSFRQSGKRYLNTYRIAKVQSAKPSAGIMEKCLLPLISFAMRKSDIHIGEIPGEDRKSVLRIT